MNPIIQRFKSMLSMLMLMLTLSIGTVFSGLGTENCSIVPPFSEFSPVEMEIPETEEGDNIQPLSDLDEPVTLDKI